MFEIIYPFRRPNSPTIMTKATMEISAIASRTQAQKRADDIHIFQQEMHRLEDEGVIQLDATQRAAVNTHHQKILAFLAQQFDIDRDAQSKQLSLGMRIVSFLGALALAASMFFLFYQFWDQFNELAQTGILISCAIASHLITMWVSAKDSSGYFTKLAAMVSFTCFVLNISMLGQIYNLTSSENTLLPWAILAFLFAYACELRLLLAVGIFFLVSWVGACTGTWHGVYWLHFGERPENFLMPAMILFLFPIVVCHDRFPGFPGVMRVFAMLTFFLPVLVLANWGNLSYWEVSPKIVQGCYQVLGFVGTAAAIWLGARREWPEVVNTGITLFIIFFYTKFFDWCWQIMPKYLFFMILGLISILFLQLFRRLRFINTPVKKSEKI